MNGPYMVRSEQITKTRQKSTNVKGLKESPKMYKAKLQQQFTDHHLVRALDLEQTLTDNHTSPAYFNAEFCLSHKALCAVKSI